MRPQLVIGNKNYSSWSLRAWLALRVGGVDFEELRLPLDTEEFARRIGDYSPGRTVPALHHGDLVVWDSLAICEYAAETWPEAAQWPRDPAARAHARAVSAEMHSGFDALRAELPMNIRRHFDTFSLSPAVEANVERVFAIWASCFERRDSEGPFLFGAFGIADAMYAPVTSRLLTYRVALPPAMEAYCHAVHEVDAMREWCNAGRAETETVHADEV